MDRGWYKYYKEVHNFDDDMYENNWGYRLKTLRCPEAGLTEPCPDSLKRTVRGLLLCRCYPDCHFEPEPDLTHQPVCVSSCHQVSVPLDDLEQFPPNLLDTNTSDPSDCDPEPEPIKACPSNAPLQISASVFTRVFAIAVVPYYRLHRLLVGHNDLPTRYVPHWVS